MLNAAPILSRFCNSSRVLVTLLALVGAAQIGFSTPVAAETSEDNLFGGMDLVSDVNMSAAPAAPEEELLQSEGVEIGGRFNYTLGSTWQWSSSKKLREDGFSAPARESLSSNLQGTLYLDARPKNDYRVFGKAIVSYPFTERPAAGMDAGRSFDDIVHITELFSYFNHEDKVFFRAGKQAINWGVGYFFSPADIVNLTPLDPAEPEAEREGPLSLKANMPLDANNLYLYLIADNAATARDIALAPKAEIVVGPAELGLGAFYQRNRAPVAMVTVSSALGDFAVFGEGVYKHGSDKRFVKAVDPAIDPLEAQVYTTKEQDFLLGTVGARFSIADDNDLFNFNLAGQYFYNGEGYEDQGLLLQKAPAFLLTKQITPSDLMWSGKHYAAATVLWSDALKTDVSINTMWLGNLADKSGQFNTSLSWEPLERVTATVGMSYNYGKTGSEYAYAGNPVSFYVRTTLGSGQF